MDSVQFYGYSLEVQLSYYEKKVVELQKDLDNLGGLNMPRSILNELGQAFDSALDGLVEAKQSFQNQQPEKARSTLNQLIPYLDQLSHLVAVGGKLSLLRLRMDELLKYRVAELSSLESYRRTLIRKLSVTIGMARNRYDTVSWQLLELERGIEQLEFCFDHHSTRLPLAKSFAVKPAMAL
jgi:hypothetical protein